MTHWKRLWWWEGLGAGGEGDDRGWDGWMASPIRWTWIWVSSGSWWWTGRPGVLQFMGSQKVGHDWATELNWTEYSIVYIYTISFLVGFETNFPDSKSLVFFLLQCASCRGMICPVLQLGLLGPGIEAHGRILRRLTSMGGGLCWWMIKKIRLDSLWRAMKNKQRKLKESKNLQVARVNQHGVHLLWLAYPRSQPSGRKTMGAGQVVESLFCPHLAVILGKPLTFSVLFSYLWNLGNNMYVSGFCEIRKKGLQESISYNIRA